MKNLHLTYVNLEHRPDRRLHMEAELKRIGLNAKRIPGILPHEYNGDPKKIQTMLKRTPGAIGCHFSQVKCMQEALSLHKHAFVMEDDLVFCSDFKKRLAMIETFTDEFEWDVFWLGGTYHVNPAYWHTGRNPDLKDSFLGRDAELTSDPRIVRTYGCFSTFAYIVNVKSIEKILKLLDRYVAVSMGIDWLFIKLQPELFTFAFAPGCVKQMDNQSDIGTGITYFSGFEKLGPHWFQDKIEDFDPLTYCWNEASPLHSINLPVK
jgi:GR25 family glycosyltransferase involved in LPS biosynthesis